MAEHPLVACFHGGGSTGEIFNIQCARLQRLLKDELEFIFFDGPFKRPAGPGVLPIFEDYGPFRSWFKDWENLENTDGGGFDASGKDGVQRAWEMMEERAPKEEWIGVMGFSQGTRAAGGLLLDQQRRLKENDSNGFNLRFGILCMPAGSVMETANTKFQEQPITIPSLHLHGLKDEFVDYSKKQTSTYYSPDTRNLFEIDYHHAMPWAADDLNHFAELIKKLYRNNRG
ncbi:MAG: hypothetical protein M1821_000785 [Bathelium mastoideum]|nr:MAG: hypothetical protein M1821_000785 [Bathelium mastoideum]KAI9694186.1 MAG: hypothetical protein M1822_003457 [Bathelium mastoideum]